MKAKKIKQPKMFNVFKKIDHAERAVRQYMATKKEKNYDLSYDIKTGTFVDDPTEARVVNATNGRKKFYLVETFNADRTEVHYLDPKYWGNTRRWDKHGNRVEDRY